MERRRINPFQVVTVKLKLKTSNAKTYELDPQISCIDESGEIKTCKPDPITITVQPSKPKYEALPGRITTGFEELDVLLFGGIPENYAMTLTAPSTDEEELIVKRFLEAGAIAGETTFHITAEAANTKALAEEHPSNFYLIVCNLQADAMIQNMPNVFKLKGVENLTEIDIALTKAFRTLNQSAKGAKRICLGIVSDILLQHHAINTRRWLSALLPTLKLKGFTILAVVDPSMHPSEELQAVLGVFDGEIRVSEKETPEGIKQALKIKKLINQKYSDKEIILNKELLSD
jgi:KaiC/GvpD/RAD55 family RecA-like ATPase